MEIPLDVVLVRQLLLAAHRPGDRPGRAIGGFPDGFDRYYTSEYFRAMETAARLSLPSAEWVLHPALRESSWGTSTA
ncbi:MAG: hypothetical protein ACREX8_05580 [Gammaproteobacteria bacterium]